MRCKTGNVLSMLNVLTKCEVYIYIKSHHILDMLLSNWNFRTDSVSTRLLCQHDVGERSWNCIAICPVPIFLKMEMDGRPRLHENTKMMELR